MKNPFPNDDAKAHLWTIALASPPAEPESPTPATPENRRRKQLARLVADLRGPAKGLVCDALSRELGAGFGEDIDRVSGSFRPGMAIVPLRNPNSHNYPLGKPVLYGSPAGDCSGYYFNDEGGFESGNNLPSRNADGIVQRLATPEELRAALENLSADAAKELLLIMAACSAVQAYGKTPYEVLDRIPEALEKLGKVADTPESTSPRRPRRRPGRPESAPIAASSPASDPFEL